MIALLPPRAGEGWDGGQSSEVRNRHQIG